MPKTSTFEALAELRIGQGIDLHRLVIGRPCVIGGVKIDSSVGSDAHSDGDVLLHALMDALLGAVGHPDIGARFPNTDARFQDADSSALLADVWGELSKDWAVINIDCSVVCETPKIAPYRAAMKRRISEILQTSEDRVGIKATTAEKLGALGRGEGILAQAVVLLGAKRA